MGFEREFFTKCLGELRRRQETVFGLGEEISQSFAIIDDLDILAKQQHRGALRGSWFTTVLFLRRWGRFRDWVLSFYDSLECGTELLSRSDDFCKGENYTRGFGQFDTGFALFGSNVCSIED